MIHEQRAGGEFEDGAPDGVPRPPAAANDQKGADHSLAQSTGPLIARADYVEPSSREPTPELTHLYHSTSPLALPLIFRFGLYLSSERFTVFRSKPSLDWGWADNLVPLVIRVPSDRVVRNSSWGLSIGFPDSVRFPDELRTELEKLAEQWVEGDQSVTSSEKSKEQRAAVNGARLLLKAEQEGTLRHFGTECIDIERTREGNQASRYRRLAGAYINALERNGGKPVEEEVKLLPKWLRYIDEKTFPLRRRWNR